MIFDSSTVTSFLKGEFERRVKKNERYSLRGFAKALNVNAAELSQVFSGARKLSWKSADRVARALGLTPPESKHLMLLLQAEKNQNLGLELSILEGQQHPDQIEMRDFERVTEWYHFAILNLIDSKDFEWTASHISTRLGITVAEATFAMVALVETKMIALRINSGGKKQATATKRHFEIGSKIPSSAVRRYHQQCLRKAIEAIDGLPTEQRSYRGVGLVANQVDLEKINIEISKFTEFMQSRFHRKGRSTVYQVQIAVFPISKESP